MQRAHPIAAHRPRLATLVVLLLGLTAVARAGAPALTGRIVDPTGLPLPGVVVSLSPVAGGSPVTSTTSDDKGRYELVVQPGHYRLTAELSGFSSARKDDVVVGPTPVTLDLRLDLAPFQESVAVQADTLRPLLGSPEPNAPATVTRPVIDSAMLPNSRYDDVLTLMPGVVRGPDNEISIGGAPASAGGLFVNGFNHDDPTTGRPGLVVPIEAVETVQVHAGGYSAGLGPAAAGITSVETRSGSDTFHASLDSMFPRLLFDGKAIRGVSFWEPNVGASGPIVKGRIFFVEGLSYRLDRNPFTTLSGDQHNLFTAPLSWTQVDARVSETHHLRASAAFNLEHTDRANITAFTSPGAAPDLRRNAFSATLADQVDAGRDLLLEARASIVKTRSSLTPAGTLSFDMGHDLLSGSYFDRQLRDARRLEGGLSAVWSASAGHVFKAGTTVGSADLDARDTSAPVHLLRSDGTLSRVVTFLDGQPAAIQSTDSSGFFEDTWSARSWFTVSSGVRYDHHSVTADSRWSPRIAWTMKTGAGGTAISGSVGRFADKIALGSFVFPDLPARTIATLDSSGQATGPAVRYVNTILGPLVTPTATRWDASLDERLNARWQMHLRYQERYGHDELVVAPVPVSADRGMLALSNSGTSTSRGVEATVGYRAPDPGGEFYVSYVRASARGHMNSVEQVAGLFKEPFIQSDAVGPLPADVPNRMLAWGLIQLPGRVTVAPFVDVRSGFPYSAIDDDWMRVGEANSQRLPWFGSLDLSITTVAKLPAHLPRARVGLKLYNILSVHTEREVQRDLFASDAGMRYNPVPRDFTLVCVFLLGHH